MAIHFRMHKQDDESELMRLWSEQSGWGEVDPTLWRHLLLEAPYGEARIVVAEDAQSQKIVGQFAFVPSLVTARGRSVTALRPFAPVLDKSQRTQRSLNPLNHPILAMYRYAVKELRSRGDGLIYMLPDPNWMTVLRLLPFMMVDSFPLWSLPLPLSQPFELPSGYTAGPLTIWDERVDQLWAVASRLYDCSVIRDSRTLPWKMEYGNFTVTAIEREGELVGLVTGLQKNDRQWIVSDLLAKDADITLRAVLMATSNAAQSAAGERSVEGAKQLQKVSVLATPLMQPVLQELGFSRDNYVFPMVVHILDGTISRAEVAPKGWYLSATD